MMSHDFFHFVVDNAMFSKTYMLSHRPCHHTPIYSYMAKVLQPDIMIWSGYDTAIIWCGPPYTLVELGRTINLDHSYDDWFLSFFTDV